MLCVVIKGPSITEAIHQIETALKYADLVELRLDFFNSLETETLKHLRGKFSIPMIFTLRSQQQGGNYQQSENCRLDQIRQLAALNPEYLDLESHIPRPFIEEIARKHPQIKVILSSHNFTETPQDLESLYCEMKRSPAHFYKIAVTAHNAVDALRLVSWAKKSDNQLIAISMGLYGQLSRILGPVIGNPITYASLDSESLTAPGQLSAKTLRERYHYRSLTPRTAIYGLIGDPVDLSISDETHNHFMRVCGLEAVYVKIPVKATELSEFLQLAKQLPFSGMSVTMPLKECILPYLDRIDPHALEVGAVNTLLFQNGKITGFNTDGKGALNAIAKKMVIQGKQVVVVGAGGAAKAIAYEINQRGGSVTIINRDEDKAKELATRVHGHAKGLEQMSECAKKGYDVLINCTPLPLPIAFEDILPQALVMDIKTKPKDTPFLKCALEKKCPVVYGYEMFVHQAVIQFTLWFKERVNASECCQILEKKAVEALKT